MRGSTLEEEYLSLTATELQLARGFFSHMGDEERGYEDLRRKVQDLKARVSTLDEVYAQARLNFSPGGEPR